MDDFIELGLEAADKCVDKNFHKIPEKAMHTGTYRPHNIKNAVSERLRGDDLAGSDSGSDNDASAENENQRQDQNTRMRLDEDDGKRLDPATRLRDSPHKDVSDAPRYHDASSGESRPPFYKDSPLISLNERKNVGIDSNSPCPDHLGCFQNNLYRRGSLPYDQSRPRDMDDQREHENTQGHQNNRRRRTLDERRDSPLKRTSKSMNTSSNKSDSDEAGLRYGAVGAMLGGLAAQELATKNTRGRKNEKVAFAMLGAVVGALAGKSIGERVHDDRGKRGRTLHEGRYDREYNTNPK
ncbi:hypothetical protein MFRU_005g01170 [Monilinia fructicola]|uniref:Glycine zipper 2TM domain-containing protein n=1 Tax=Monilinia fructicola TaxID=38448 RepID=A0A5M9JNH6_MONFR|nr:hypothetical protein EYC84_002301 [Monilinia fructicola]KAG4033100.1 hypothetical protein MFRU_005g01170 [Monilinia fructicola]